MKALIAILTTLPVIAWGQKELTVEGKMIYGKTKKTTLMLIENDTDTSIIELTKKKFALPTLSIDNKYDLIFNCAERTKSLTISPSDEGENKHLILELDWTMSN